MRPQLVPIILCFFMTIALNVYGSKSTKNDTYNVAESTVYSNSSEYSIDLIITKDTKDVPKKETAEKRTKKENITVKSSVGKSNIKNTIEENSYNNILAIDSNNEKSSINFYSFSTNQEELFNLGLYYGFALTMVFLNIVCFLLFDEKIFLYYSMVLAGLASVFFYDDGLFSLFTGNDVIFNAAIETSLLLITIGVSALFVNKYLNIREIYPNLFKLVLPLYISASILTILTWSNGNEYYASTANALLFGIMSVYFIAGVLLFSRKNYVKFYVIAYCIPLLFVIDYFVLRRFSIDFLFTESVHLKVAILAEMLIVTYAIMFRMKAIKEENELRQTEMRIFLKRQDVMNRQNVEQMIEDVYLENLIMHYDLDGLEIKLLQYISEGKTNDKIARLLKLSDLELEEEIKYLYEKLEIGEQIQEDYRMVDNQPDYLYN